MAGLMIAGVLVGSVIVTIGVAIKKGWFEEMVELRASFTNAEGLHAGTQVLMSGLRVGQVVTIDLKGDNSIDVHFVIQKKFFDRIREDSLVRMVRPFVIGDKVLDVSVGSATSPQLLVGEYVQSVETTDIMDLMSGRKLGPAIEAVEGLTTNLKVLVEAFADPQRVQSLIKAFDTLNPLIDRFNTMAGDVSVLSRQMTKDENLKNMIENLLQTTRSMNHILPILNEESPRLGEDIGALLHNLAQLSEELKVVLPALRKVAPDLPEASQQAVVAVNELVITLKALQQSFLLSDKADEIRREMAEKRKNLRDRVNPIGPERLPASEKNNE
jgi:phospholipid/cholesterol/gamma-HCH transport system substrate-binding protein